MTQRGRLHNRKIEPLHNSQRGYLLLTLILAMALIAIATLAVLPAVKQQVQRDREEELVHRGTEYMRAIRHYYRKLGRYPTRLEDLENANGMRFIRKLYKDPMSRDPKTGKELDFKILHMEDVQLQTQAVGLPNQNPATEDGDAGNPDSSNSDSANTSNPEGNSTSDSPGSSNSPKINASGPNASSSGGSGPNGQVFGGGAILGVASKSKTKTIREFNKKNHYNDWYFIYDSTAQERGLLQGPWQPFASAGGVGIGQPQAQPEQGTSQPGIGQPQTTPVQAPSNPPSQ